VNQATTGNLIRWRYLIANSNQADGEAAREHG
jgi:hypothetical protein